MVQHIHVPDRHSPHVHVLLGAWMRGRITAGTWICPPIKRMSMERNNLMGGDLPNRHPNTNTESPNPVFALPFFRVFVVK